LPFRKRPRDSWKAPALIGSCCVASLGKLLEFMLSLRTGDDSDAFSAFCVTLGVAVVLGCAALFAVLVGSYFNSLGAIKLAKRLVCSAVASHKLRAARRRLRKTAAGNEDERGVELGDTFQHDRTKKDTLQRDIDAMFTKRKVTEQTNPLNALGEGVADEVSSGGPGAELAAAGRANPMREGAIATAASAAASSPSLEYANPIYAEEEQSAGTRDATNATTLENPMRDGGDAIDTTRTQAPRPPGGVHSNPMYAEEEQAAGRGSEDGDTTTVLATANPMASADESSVDGPAGPATFTHFRCPTTGVMLPQITM